jgi:flagellar motor switch protein FliM
MIRAAIPAPIAMAELRDPAPEPRAFALGAEHHLAAVPLDGLERIGERTAKGLRAVVEPFVRQRPVATAAPLETMRFAAWREALPAFTSLSRYRFGGLKGGALLALEPDWISRLVDVFYGGSGAVVPLAIRPSEFTAGEERVAARVADGVMEVLAGAWADLAPLPPALIQRDVHASAAHLVPDGETVVVQRFAVDAGPAGTTRIDMVYPLAALRAHPVLTSARQQAEASPADHRFRRQLAAALENVQLPVRSVLARPTLSVDQLLSLKPGDVIPIALGPRVPLLVANRRVADGTIGEQEGRAALMIEEIAGDA